MVVIVALILHFFILDMCKSLDPPSQIHLSLGDTNDVMTVVWSTSNDVIGYVSYGVSQSDLNMKTNSTTAKLQSNNWKSMKVIHRAQMHSLSEGLTYFYRVTIISGQDACCSRVYSFKTIDTHSDKPRQFLVYGDLGKEAGKPTFPVLKEEIETGNYDVIWHVGDFAYNMESDGGKTGDDFFKEIEPIATRIPYMTSPGNHELANQLHHYRTRFSMPGSQWPMPIDKLWYSYNIGHVHFISYSTEVYFIDNQDYVCQQYNWLLKDLTEANRNRDKQPWIIAMGHRPMYCSNQNADDCTGRFLGYWVKYGLEELFHVQGVDLVIQAHEHSYERLWPVYNSQTMSYNYTNPPAPVHITSGAAGCGEGIDRMGPPDPWSAFRAGRESFHSFGKLTVHNVTHLHFVQETVSPRGVLDSFWLVQYSHGPRWNTLIDCSNPDKWHDICDCPLPFHYLTVAIVMAVVLTLIIFAICLCCCRKRLTCFKNLGNTFAQKLRLKFSPISRYPQHMYQIDRDTNFLLDDPGVEI